MKAILKLERASLFDVTCPLTGQAFRVQLWDAHEMSSDQARRRMAVAVWANSPAWPNKWNLLGTARRFYPAPSVSCDGTEAALAAVRIMLETERAYGFSDCLLDDPENPPSVEPVSSSDEGQWL